MGRGKSTAAFRHINENVGKLKFLFVTPYLEEVDRACVNCEFIQPSSTSTKSKLGSLVKYMHEGKNVALTHELFKRFTMDVAELVRERGYHLILDEVFDATENLDLSIYQVDENIEIIEEKAQKRAQKSASFFDLIDGAVNSIAGTSTDLGTESVRVRYQREERAKKGCSDKKKLFVKN